MPCLTPGPFPPLQSRDGNRCPGHLWEPACFRVTCGGGLHVRMLCTDEAHTGQVFSGSHCCWLTPVLEAVAAVTDLWLSEASLQPVSNFLLKCSVYTKNVYVGPSSPTSRLPSSLTARCVTLEVCVVERTWLRGCRCVSGAHSPVDWEGLRGLCPSLLRLREGR